VFVHGLDRLAPEALEQAIAAGGRIVFFEYCISLIFVSLRRQTQPYFLKAGETGLLLGLRYAFLSLLLGWWGVPWGIIYTPLTLISDLSGGCDITSEVREMLSRQAGRLQPVPREEH